MYCFYIYASEQALMPLWSGYVMFQHVAMAHELENLMKADDRFEITHEVTLGLVCFKLKVRHNVCGRISLIENISGMYCSCSCEVLNMHLLRELNYIVIQYQCIMMCHSKERLLWLLHMYVIKNYQLCNLWTVWTAYKPWIDYRL